MVCHGKRNGIDYCLSIRRSNQSVKDCTTAIKISINKLEIAHLNTFYIDFCCHFQHRWQLSQVELTFEGAYGFLVVLLVHYKVVYSQREQ